MPTVDYRDTNTIPDDPNNPSPLEDYFRKMTREERQSFLHLGEKPTEKPKDEEKPNP